MNRETGGYVPPEIAKDNLPPILQQYLSTHSDLSLREQDFLIQHYKNLKTEMTTRSAGVFKQEAQRVKKQAGSSADFKKAWGTKSQDPDQGANVTKILMGEFADIQETAAKQTIELFEMRRIAEIDSITGLYRGNAFDKYAAETLQANQELIKNLNLGKTEGERLVSVYVAFDIDDFKTINETIGHVRADTEILAKIGELIKGTKEQPGIIRSTDLASRIGGDEFVILFTQIREDSVQATIERLLQSFNSLSYTTSEGEVVPVTVSAGVKIIEADEKITLKKARHCADEAANLAKIEKNTFQFYTPDAQTKIEQMLVEEPDKALEFYIRQERQRNKRAIEDIIQYNKEEEAEFEENLKKQAQIKLKTKLRQLTTN